MCSIVFSMARDLLLDNDVMKAFTVYDYRIYF